MNGSTNYRCLDDVDLPQKASVLDQALNLLLASEDHRQSRREIEGRVKERERNLKADLAAAKELSLEASKEAAALNQNSFWNSPAGTTYQPIFTTIEIAEIEKRIQRSSSSKETQKLTSTLVFTNKNSESFNEILRKALGTEKRDEEANERAVPIPEPTSILEARKRTGCREPNDGIER